MGEDRKQPGESVRDPYRLLEQRRVFSDVPPERDDEFPAGAADPIELPADAISRRRFLTMVSASAALALGTASCSRIDRGTIVPYTRKPLEIHPGVANYFASTFQEGLVTHGVLVKTREGRPIHIEGNDEDPIWRGKASLRAIGDILGLYDPDRLRGPVADGNPTSWDKALEGITGVLRQARANGKPVLLLTEAVVSPTKRALIEELKKALPGLRHAAWEPAASQSEIAASRALFKDAMVPQYRLDRADVVLSLQADFLGADPRATVFIRDFAARRVPSKPSDAMNRLWVVEGTMTLTGANADHRFQVPPSRIARLVFALIRSLQESSGKPLLFDGSPYDLSPFALDATARDLQIPAASLSRLAQDLKQAGKSALVVAGAALPPEAHIACWLLNTMLESEGHTVDMRSAPQVLTFADLRDLFKEASRGTFAAAVFWGANPAYAFPDESLWKSAASNIPNKIRIGLYEDETALECRWRLPEHHWLESWGDFDAAQDYDAVQNLLSLRQPAIGAIHNTRQGEDILLSWLRGLGAHAPQTYLEYMKARWQREVYPAGGPVPFETFWNAALHDGVCRGAAAPAPPLLIATAPVREAVSAAAANEKAAGPDELELVLQPACTLYDGRYANNGWFNELPDPVTKATWTNPVLLSVADAGRLGLKDDDLVRITAGNESIEAPVVIQPGQAPGVASISLGYGRRTGNVATGVGVNAYALMDPDSPSPHLRAVKISRAGGSRKVPRTQEHHQIVAGRNLVRSWALADYAKRIGNNESNPEQGRLPSLIPDQQFVEHKWSMVIDLSACVGCSACVIACQSENNVPVVGPEQVIRGREMQWIRIDRYYAGDPQDPTVMHQPMLCQHCDDAPCEIVCPVNATTHSSDGLNQMAYNRCVGTRYCSNNCPYKVRRFNFLDYTSMKKPPENLVYNPEVTVRPRGVMEKCSFCIQRIQDVRQRANVEHRPIKDGGIKPACAVACPAEAIVFGDLNDPAGKVSKLARANRGYHVLRELGIKPSVTYLADISNPAPGEVKA